MTNIFNKILTTKLSRKKFLILMGSSAVGIALLQSPLVSASKFGYNYLEESSQLGSSGGSIPIPVSDGKVKISSADTTADYLEPKIVAGPNVLITKQNTGANENLLIEAEIYEVDGGFANSVYLLSQEINGGGA